MTVPSSTSASLPGSSEGRSEPDLSGRRIGDYQLLRRLGRGGMAEVYLAEQLSLRRQVALKVLRRSLAGDEAYIRRFQHEAQAAAKLVHANIVQIYEVGCVDGIYYICQEYVPGQNLKQLLSRLGRGVDVVQAVNVIRQVAAGLHKAAEEKIIHRDIKPENIMISFSGEVKVADFGLARVGRDGEALNLTQVGITMGTPLYMSPEQVEGRPVDPRSDLYSFGVTCYHMLAGRPPFDGETALAVAVQHLKKEPDRLEVLRRDLPEGLCRIVHKMLAKKPEERYQRAIDLLKDLKALQIEGLDQDWTAELPGFNSADLALSTAGRLEATQQLDRVLRSELAHVPRHLRPLAASAGLIGLVLLGLLAGGLLAWVNRPEPLLAPTATERPGVKRFDTVERQYIHAQITDTEEAWNAVPDYFPPTTQNAVNRRYARLSWRQLAKLYLSNNQPQKALPLYERLAALEAAEKDFQLAGKVGMAAVYRRLAADEDISDEQAAEYEGKVKELLPDLVPEASDPRLSTRISPFLANELQQLVEFYQLDPDST
jgi:serine/threonine-protein kinase